VSDHVRRLTTEEQRERFHTARRRGGLCAACGRPLRDGEPVYIERFMTGVARRARPTGVAHPVYVLGPVGVECASPDFLYEMLGRAPERCAWCERGVYYRATDPRRRRVLCSRGCASRANPAGIAKGLKEAEVD
jgi:hypothetical protein